MDEIIIGKVVKVLSDTEIVIDKGSEDGVKDNNRFLIYYLGEEIFDENKKNLGKLEYVCGEGKVKHIQPKMTTIVSDKYKKKILQTVVKRSTMAFFGDTTEETYDPETMIIPFEDVEEGYLAKQIK